ncbi:MAG: hypothetical protein ACTHN0_07170 [Aquihabitans sp.]
MSDDLRGAMAAEAGAGARPDIGGIWREGRRRRSVRRWVRAGGAAGAVLLVAAVAVQVMDARDSGQEVRTADASTTIDAGTCSPVPRGEGQAPPETIGEFVHGRGGDASDVTPVVVRAKVRETRWFGPSEIGTDPTSWYHVVVLDVTDPVTGAHEGDWLNVLDVDPVPPKPRTKEAQDDIAAQRKETEAEIEELQKAVDELDRPLAELDEQILSVPPDDPRYQALIESRERVRQRTDAQRTEKQAQLSEYKQQLQQLQLAEDRGLSPDPPVVVDGPPCHLLAVGDDVIVSLVPGDNPEVYRLASPSSFFVIDADGRFSTELDEARRSVPSWGGDSELLQAARDLTPEEFLDRLRQAAGN